MGDDVLATLTSLAPPGGVDRWYVTDGATSVGPVGLELLGRGIAAGKVPLDGFVRHEDWTRWRRLSDLGEADPVFDIRKTIRMGTAVPLAYAAAAEGAPKDVPKDARAPAAPVKPPPAPPRPELAESTWRAASDLPEALLLLLAEAVKQCGADVALLHDVRPDGAVVVCSHGPRMFEAIGARTPLGDPAIAAARLGQTVMAEPAPAPAGRAIRGRLSKAGSKAAGAFMVPLRQHGELTAFLEVGRETPFRAREVAAVEALVDALVREVEEHGWGAEWIGDDDVTEGWRQSRP
ncbi:MAG TPA: GAF domain-containing protein [Minicystis sp.]|nr:GAF domain-containing protein [Minicystis sp.]